MNDRTKWLVDQIEKYVDDNLYGQIHVDLMDMIEICESYIRTIEDKKEMTEGELENFIINLEVNLIDHAQFHLKSLRKGLRRVLAKFPKEEP